MSVELNTFADVVAHIIRLLAHVYVKYDASLTCEIPDELVISCREASEPLVNGDHPLDIPSFGPAMRRFWAVKDAIHLLKRLYGMWPKKWLSTVAFLARTEAQVFRAIGDWAGELAADWTAKERSALFWHITHRASTDASPEVLAQASHVNLHCCLDYLAFAARMGQLDFQDDMLPRLRHLILDTHLDCRSPELIVPLNEMLPEDMPPILGGTPLFKMDRLVAFAQNAPLLLEVQTELRHMLELLVRRLGGLPAGHVATSIIYAKRGHENGFNLLAALPEDQLLSIMRQLRLQQ